MISNKARYAFRALLAIADARGGDLMTSPKLAERYKIPHKFLEQILLDLTKAGILESRRGKNGGYVMLRPADTVSLGEVLRLFEGPLAPLPCLSRQSYRRCEDCIDEARCDIRREFGRAYDFYRRHLDSTTLADALAGDPARRDSDEPVRRSA